jgi:hypothetical protein
VVLKKLTLGGILPKVHPNGYIAAGYLLFLQEQIKDHHHHGPCDMEPLGGGGGEGGARISERSSAYLGQPVISEPVR